MRRTGILGRRGGTNFNQQRGANMITVERLKELLNYNETTGAFTWKVTPKSYRVAVGDVAGGVHSKGYIHIKIDGVTRFAHRLAWLYVFGSLPKQQIDHINRIKTDNRISNLRDVSATENNRNTSRFKGICLAPEITICHCFVCGSAVRRKTVQYVNDIGKGHRVTCSSKCRSVLIVEAKSAKRRISEAPNKGE